MSYPKQPPRRAGDGRRSADPLTDRHERMMAEIRDHAQQTNAQIDKLAEQIGKLVTAVSVMQSKMENHVDRMDDMERRMEGFETRERGRYVRNENNTFTLGNNYITWIIMIIVGLLGAYLSGHLH